MPANLYLRRTRIYPDPSRRKRSESGLSSTPSDQRPREEKSAPYRNPQYELVLNTKGTFMKESKEDISDASKLLCQKLLDGEHRRPC